MVGEDLLQTFCEPKGLFFVDNSNINLPCLNKSTLNLNTKGTLYLARNVIDTISSCAWNVSCAGIREGKGLDYENYNVFLKDTARKVNVSEILR